MPTLFERLVHIQNEQNLDPLPQAQKALLGKLVWQSVKPIDPQHFPLQKVKSEEPEGFSIVNNYPPELTPIIDKAILDYYAKATRKKRTRIPVKIPAYSVKRKP